MSEKPGTESPFAAFSAAFPSAAASSFAGANPDAWQKMWSMFAPPAPGAVPGSFPAGPFGGMGPSLSMMSELVAPLTNVANLAELDKRIADLRAVEHWLKFNLQMLQSTTQALEVQRATLATLRAFGTATGEHSTSAETSKTSETSAAPSPFPGMDPALWWGTLNDQFKQMAAAAAAATAAAMPAARTGKPTDKAKTATPAKTQSAAKSAPKAARSAAAPPDAAGSSGTAARRTTR